MLPGGGFANFSIVAYRDWSPVLLAGSPSLGPVREPPPVIGVSPPPLVAGTGLFLLSAWVGLTGGLSGVQFGRGVSMGGGSKTGEE